jgi:hypothetical protein
VAATLTGFGVAVNLRAPFNTIFRAELGKACFRALRFARLDHAQIQFLKPLK